MEQLKYNIFSGSISGLCEVIATHPLDLLKTKAQYTKNTKLSHFKQLYKGIRPRLYGVIPMRTVFWSSIETSNYLLETFNIHDTYRLLVAGAVAGIAQSVIDIPIENVKIQNITRNVYDFKKINLYRGSLITISRNVGFAIILNIFIHTNNDHSNKKIDFCRAGLGAVVGSILTHPMDYIKTQIQSDTYPTTWSVVKNTKINKYGAGCLSRASMGFINMGIGYTIFSSINDIILKNK